MDINFPLILMCLVAAGAFIWIADALVFSKSRAPGDKEPALVENAKALTPVLALVFVIRSFLYEPFQIPSGSMERTLLVGDFILVNKYTYGIRLPVWRTKVFDINTPERGDVMVFFPPHKDQYYIKRVVGLPGDLVEYKDKVLKINGQLQEQTIFYDNGIIDHTQYQNGTISMRSQYDDPFTNAEDWDQIESLGFDQEFKRKWLYYFSYCEAGFMNSLIDVKHLVVQK